MPRYKNLDVSAAFGKLKAAEKPILKSLITPERIASCQIPAGGGLTFNYAAKAVSPQTLKLLTELAREAEVIEKYRSLLNGAVMNTGEKRKVLHHLTRARQLDAVEDNGKDLGAFYAEQQKRAAAFAQKIHDGSLKGSTGKKFDTVVQIGIGGSDLGPRALYMALQNCCKPKMQAAFISNVDPDDANAVLAGLNLETTLFILVSKSGTTQETLANSNFVAEKARKHNIAGYNVSKHMIAVTSETSPLAKNKDFLDAFYIDDYIGGRYSSTSVVGTALLTLVFGEETVNALLAGAAEADKLALTDDPLQNAALLDALIGVYERNILGYGATAVLPYSQALLRFPAHLQQLDMESNGKSVNRDGEPVSYATGPVVFGEPGTNGQHSFYQLLHQGTDIIPLQFIGFNESQTADDTVFEGSTSQTKLKANLAAQIVAFAAGHADKANPNKNFAGGRPSSLIYGDKLDAKALGALLAHFENKVMFQGFLWNLNSFDQEGVQLGKTLATALLKGDGDDVLKGFAKLLNI
jgi:glucose-6-phosphate isomerase